MHSKQYRATAGAGAFDIMRLYGLAVKSTHVTLCFWTSAASVCAASTPDCSCGLVSKQQVQVQFDDISPIVASL
jgi:hypothetical protein